MRVILDVLEGPQKGRSFVFERHDTFIVGRSRYVHCPMPEDMALSRDHFMIEINPPQCELRDLGSTNGTFVNNQRVDRVRLALGRHDRRGAERLPRRGAIGPFAQSRRTMCRGRRRRPGSSTTAQIRCAGCNCSGASKLDDCRPGRRRHDPNAVEWWCALCRSEAATLPQPVPYYTTLRELGRGAMGVVYQARHNLTGQMVALKLIMPETATTRAAIDRFQREMSVISQLRHPNIVEWYEQGMTRGQFWFAMEYVVGTNLETLAKAEPGRYPIKQACRLACQVLKGLEQAHQHGFVHRDIKPENILIANTPEGPLVKISDFGLAKSFRGVGLSGLTFSGEMREPSHSCRRSRCSISRPSRRWPTCMQRPPLSITS